jgi:RimJ/RimL family protein N-acetyltransferase
MFTIVAISPGLIRTDRLVLAPVSREVAEAVVAGDLSAVDAAEGWPHDDTLDGLKMALDLGHAPGWFVELDGVVIGDCGIHRDPDERGEVEIGFGLAAPYRGRGFGGEVVGGLSRWLLEQPGVRRVCARVLLENQPSQRVLQRSGFTVEFADRHQARYVLERPAK